MTEIANTDLQLIVARLADVLARKADLEQEEKTLKASIRAACQVGDKLTVNGTPVIGLQPNRRFSTDLAEQTLAAPLLDLCRVTKIDPAAAKKNLPPALYETCMADTGEAKVVLL